MPPVAETEVRGFALSDFGGPGAPPDDHVNPPSNGAAPAAKPPAEAKPAVAAEPEIKPLATEDEPDPPAPPENEEPAKTSTLESAMEDPVETQRNAAEAEAAEKKKTDEAAAAAAADTGAKTAEQRDADLKVEHGSHVHPNTRKRFEAVTAKAKAARDERDAAISKAAELEKRALAAEEKAKAVVVPEAAETELKALRERVRELDITQDPQIQAKYDKKITTNNDAIIGVLKKNGFDRTVINKETGETIKNPRAVAELTKAGLTLNNLHPHILALEKAGLIEEAAEIREAVMENKRIARERQSEIEAWKGNHSTRVQERENLTKQQQEKQGQAFRTHTESVLKADLEVLAKDFSYINRPAAPLPTDIPATVQAKQAAIAEFDTAAKAIEAAVKSFDATGAPPDKLPEIIGRLNAAAIQSVVLKNHVLPRVIKDLAARDARIKQLEGELSAIRGAGKLSRAQGSAPDANANRGSEARTLEEAFTDPTRG